MIAASQEPVTLGKTARRLDLARREGADRIYGWTTERRDLGSERYVFLVTDDGGRVYFKREMFWPLYCEAVRYWMARSSEGAMNLHGEQLEKILIQKGLSISKLGSNWVITNGQPGGKKVTYTPESGIVITPKTALRYPQREELRGSPERIAQIIEGFLL